MRTLSSWSLNRKNQYLSSAAAPIATTAAGITSGSQLSPDMERKRVRYAIAPKEAASWM